MSYEDHLAEDARLVIARELAAMTDHTLNETILTEVLDRFGHRRSREWVRTQLNKMQELGAVRITEAGPILIATLTRAGLDHAERRSVIEGIRRPSPES